MSHVETMISCVLWHMAVYPRAICEGQDEVHGPMQNPGLLVHTCGHMGVMNSLGLD